jgi:hypothetical protein
LKALLKLIAAIIIIAIIVSLALVIFDLSGYPRDPAHTTANAILTSIRNLFPATWVENYDLWRLRFLDWFGQTFGPSKTGSFGSGGCATAL